MIRIIEGLPDGVFGLEAAGVIGGEEFDDVMLAFTDKVRRRYDVALLLDFATDTTRSAGMLDTSRIRAIRVPNSQSESIPAMNRPTVVHSVITWPSRVEAAIAIAERTSIAIVMPARPIHSCASNASPIGWRAKSGSNRRLNRYARPASGVTMHSTCRSCLWRNTSE